MSFPPDPFPQTYPSILVSPSGSGVGSNQSLGSPATEAEWSELPANITNKLVQGSDGCWIWTGAITVGGYGQLNRRGRKHPAHRFVYELPVGPVGPGLQMDHLCRVRACVNPAHVEPVTQRENILRGNGWAGRHARKTECPQGHPYDAENTYRTPQGFRYCRTCHRTNEATYRAARARA